MRVFVAIVLLFLPVAAFAQTEKRVALLIGNSFQTAFASGIARELQKHVAILERENTVQPPKRRQCHCRARHHPKNILCIQIYCWRSTILRARCWRRRWLVLVALLRRRSNPIRTQWRRLCHGHVAHLRQCHPPTYGTAGGVSANNVILTSCQPPGSERVESPGGISPPGAPRTVREPLEFTRLPMFGRCHGIGPSERRDAGLPGGTGQTNVVPPWSDGASA